MSDHKHTPEAGPVGVIAALRCITCKWSLCSSEIEIHGTFVEVGGFCDNAACIRYLLLVV